MRLRDDPIELVRERQRLQGRWCKYRDRKGGAFCDAVRLLDGKVVAAMSDAQIVPSEAVEPASQTRQL